MCGHEANAHNSTTLAGTDQGDEGEPSAHGRRGPCAGIRRALDCHVRPPRESPDPHPGCTRLRQYSPSPFPWIAHGRCKPAHTAGRHRHRSRRRRRPDQGRGQEDRRRARATTWPSTRSRCRGRRGPRAARGLGGGEGLRGQQADPGARGARDQRAAAVGGGPALDGSAARSCASRASRNSRTSSAQQAEDAAHHKELVAAVADPHVDLVSVRAGQDQGRDPHRLHPVGGDHRDLAGTVDGQPSGAARGARRRSRR